MRIIAAICIVSISLLASPAHADVSTGTYKSTKKAHGKNWESLQLYLSGVGMGYQYANIAMTIVKKQPIYCPPENFSLNSDNLIEILEKQLQKSPGPDAAPIEPALFLGLVNTFPCKR
jgi:hypothetical protein